MASRRLSLQLQLVIIFTLCETVVSSACTQYPYSLFLPLSTYPPAESFCSSRFPVAPCPPTTITTTVTSTDVSTSSDIVDYEVTTDDTNLSTTSETVTQEVYTGYVTSTVFVDTATVSVTTLVPSTSTIDVTSVVTSTITLAARQIKERQVSSTNALGASLSRLSSLASQASAIASTVCSCIEAQPICSTVTATVTTVTSTETTVPITITSTFYETLTTQTSTVYESEAITIPTTVAPTTLTVSVTITDTIYYHPTCTGYVTPEAPCPNCGDGDFCFQLHQYRPFRITYDYIAYPATYPIVYTNQTCLSDCAALCNDASTRDSNCGVFVFEPATETCTLYLLHYPDTPPVSAAPGLIGGQLLWDGYC